MNRSELRSEPWGTLLFLSVGMKGYEHFLYYALSSIMSFKYLSKLWAEVTLGHNLEENHFFLPVGMKGYDPF